MPATAPQKVVDRVLSHTERVGDCLVSRYSVGSHGYPQVGWNADGRRTMTLCHRVVWIAANGPVPDGYTVDHNHDVCTTRRCINIDHLRLLTNFENARRTSGRNWEVGTCLNGHSNDLLETDSSGKRRCRACYRVWRDKANANVRAKRKARA